MKNKIKLLLFVLVVYVSIPLASDVFNAQANSNTVKLSKQQKEYFKKLYYDEIYKNGGSKELKDKRKKKIIDSAFNCVVNRIERDYKYLKKLKRNGQIDKFSKITQAYVTKCGKKVLKKYNRKVVKLK